jgi:hypothetical protein
MNGAIKFHKATGPAFNPGEVWCTANGRGRVRVLGVWKHPGATTDYTSDYSVEYEYPDESVHNKDCWSFQIQYTHIADMNL